MNEHRWFPGARFRFQMFCGAVFAAVALDSRAALAQDAPAAEPAQLSLRELFQAGGVVGVIIVVLSIAMLALIVEHILSLRRSSLIPPGMAEDVHRDLGQSQVKSALERCHREPSLLGTILAAGLSEIGLGYGVMEKSMEDAAVEQSARLHRKIEYLSVIATLAPMLGLLGTVWGMIQAFLEFETKPNPQVAELAPGIYKALVTTLLGLSVAVPALAGYAFFRNRIDELVAEAALTSEQVFADVKRALYLRRRKPSRTDTAYTDPVLDDPPSAGSDEPR